MINIIDICEYSNIRSYYSKINGIAIQSLANTESKRPIKQCHVIFIFNLGANIAVYKHIANYRIILFIFC